MIIFINDALYYFFIFLTKRQLLYSNYNFLLFVVRYIIIFEQPQN